MKIKLSIFLIILSLSLTAQEDFEVKRLKNIIEAYSITNSELKKDNIVFESENELLSSDILKLHKNNDATIKRSILTENKVKDKNRIIQIISGLSGLELIIIIILIL